MYLTGALTISGTLTTFGGSITVLVCTGATTDREMTGAMGTATGPEPRKQQKQKHRSPAIAQRPIGSSIQRRVRLVLEFEPGGVTCVVVTTGAIVVVETSHRKVCALNV